eukprot:5306703-Amphidinium_carterae.1
MVCDGSIVGKRIGSRPKASFVTLSLARSTLWLKSLKIAPGDASSPRVSTCCSLAGKVRNQGFVAKACRGGWPQRMRSV